MCASQCSLSPGSRPPYRQSNTARTSVQITRYTALSLVRRVNARVRQYFLARPTYAGWSKLYVTWTEIRSTIRCWRLFTRNYSCLNCLKIEKDTLGCDIFRFFLQVNKLVLPRLD